MISQVLGRGEHQHWATKWPVSSLGAMLIAAVVGIGIFTYCNIELWTPAHVRENLLKVIKCGTIALGAEIYASETETKLVFHTCKSRFCTSCGQRATDAWQEDLEAILPDVPYIGITLTMPMEFRTILQQNRHLLHGIPAMGAEAIIQWAKARYGVSLFVLVVQQTFGGFLNFVPHLHVMVSAGGLQDSTNRWIHCLKFDEAELMRAWRHAVIVFLAEASKHNILRSSLSGEDLLTMFATQYKRSWNIFISRTGSKGYRLKHDGRYIRRPPIAEHRVTRIGVDQIEYLAKDTRIKQFVLNRYTSKYFVNILLQHVPDRGRHAMRYFGLLSPRCKARVWAAVFVLLNQQQRPHPPRLPWRWLQSALETHCRLCRHSMCCTHHPFRAKIKGGANRKHAGAAEGFMF